MSNYSSILLQAALNYAKLGFAVFPVHSKRENGSCTCNNDDCKSVGKHPRLGNGLSGATKDPKIIDFWWSNAFQGANIGIATGAISGFFVVDVDVKEDGLLAWENFKDDHGLDDYETVSQETPSGGKHVFYKMPKEGKVVTRTNVLARGIDIRGDGGYIVAAPSAGYRYFDDQALGEVPVLEADKSILELAVRIIDDNNKKAPDIPKVGLYDLGKDENRKILEALQFVDSDDYSTWWQVGAALHSTNGIDAFDWWCEWSKLSDKYDYNAQVKAWLDFDVRVGKTQTAIFIDFLYKLAEENGWVETFDHSDCAFDFSISNEEFQAGLKGQEVITKLPIEFINRKPSLIQPQLQPVMKFNYDMLPGSIHDYVKDVAYRMDNTSPDYVAVAFIALVAGVVGARVAVQPKENDSGWIEVPTIWAAAVGRPSAKKSPALSEVLSLLKPAQARFNKEHQEALLKFAAEKKYHSITEKAAEKKAQALARNEDTSKEAILEALTSIDTFELTEPVKRDVVINDATAEALAVRLSTNPFGILLCRDELTGWLAQMSREDRAHERAFYLEGFSAKNMSYSQERIMRDNIKLERVVVSILGGIQPSKLLPLLSSRKEGNGDDGLLERFQLAIYPDNEEVKLVDKSPDKSAKKRAKDVIMSIADIADPTGGESKVYCFTPAAQALYNQKYTEIIEELKCSDDSWQAVLGKHQTLLAKLALIIQLIDDANSVGISLESLQKSLLWLDYLQSHAKRIYGLLKESSASAVVLLSKLAMLPDSFTVSDFKSKAWSKLNSSKQRSDALNTLVINGFLYAEQIKKTHGRPVTRYHKHPSLIDK